VRYRAGVDIGGTFTDVVLMSEQGNIYVRKHPSTPDDYSKGIAEGLATLVRAAGASMADVTQLVHATTVATNAILEGKGAVTGLITTYGFRDVLEIGRLRVPRLYDLNYIKPRPLALRRHRFELHERVRADGAVESPLDEQDLSAVIESVKSSGIEAVAICLMNSYANPTHELRVRDRLVAELPSSIYVTCSFDVLPEIREYERASTTVVNAYLGPIVRSYLGALTARLRELGMTGPIQIMQSSGGLMTAEEAIAKPAYIIESGPAAGVIAAAHMARQSGQTEIITVDMGGTTAKAAIIERGEPARTTEYEVGAGINLSSKLIKGGGYAVKLPFIDVSEIGAGGGSLIGFDAGGLLQVGPQSAGSVPGPVCYDKGNETPTLTDAFVTLGYLNQKAIAGGDVKINAAKSRQAMTDKVGARMSASPEDASLGVEAVATATMSRAVKAVSTYRGRDPRDFSLFAFGGNGPMIAVELARNMGMREVIVPAHPGVFSAVGLLFSKLEHEYSKSLLTLMQQQTDEAFSEGFTRLERHGLESLLGHGRVIADFTIQRFADLRYEGQAFELTIPAATDSNNQCSVQAVVEAFHAEHRRTYGHSAPGQPVEMINHRIKVLAATDAIPRVAVRQSVTPDLASLGSRSAYFSGTGTVKAPVVRRADLRGGRKGPLIIEEYDSTCVVPPDASARLDEVGNIVITLEH
jgi:N-methylhydantoinase A